MSKIARRFNNGLLKKNQQQLQMGLLKLTLLLQRIPQLLKNPLRSRVGGGVDSSDSSYPH